MTPQDKLVAALIVLAFVFNVFYYWSRGRDAERRRWS